MAHLMASEGARRAHRRVIAAGIAGNVMEWYDFAVYGYFARTIGQLYFPADDPSLSLMAAFGAFAVGFFMRPLGAVVFGYIGDRVGRAHSLLWSVVAMAVPTFAIGLLPTYHQVGIGASVLMLLCRILQGLAVGGEYTGSVVFLAERAPPGRRGLASAWAPFGAVAGILLGSTMGTAIINAMPMADVVGWAWRLPFLFGAVVGVVGFFIRRHVSFDKAPPGKGFPLGQALREHPLEMLQVVGICIANAVGFYLIFVYVTTWLKLYAQMKIGSALLVNSLNMAIMLGVILGAAWLSDKLGRKPVMAAAAIGMAIFAWPLMALMQTGDFMNVFLGQLGFVLLIGSYNAVNPIAICELFPRAVRCSAVSTAYNITLGVVGGTAPIVATWLIEKTNYPLAPGLYVALAGVVSALATLSLRPSSQRRFEEPDLDATGAAVAMSGS
ncbi:MAG TPA: MFS transporter [Verrucomicrobiae bacterium]|nr:MFS transporter [Verrucomicrobiae bacterium]